MIDAKDACLVAVKCHELAMARKVAARAEEIIERGLRQTESQIHETTGGIVDEYEQDATLTAVLEPIVIAAVDLNQLAQTGPSWPRLMHTR